jgi:hypothetical protein
MLRLLLVAGFAAIVFFALVDGLGGMMSPNEAGVLMPFVATAACVASFTLLLPLVDKLVKRVTQDAPTTPYAALAEAAVRIRAGSLDQALPGLASVLAHGSGARRAEVWLAVEDKLVSAASYPPAEPRTVVGLAVLLAGPEVSHLVPVLDGNQLLAALTIWKPGAVTDEDQWLMRDVANGAGMLLRGVAQNATLAERVRRAGELADELGASRRRLTEARDVERRRLITELGNATTDRLATLRTDLADAAGALTDASTGADTGAATGADTGAATEAGPDAEAAQQAVHRARVRLDELLDRFRLIARGVYPSVLRDHGPFDALDELAADLPRPVRLTGRLDYRLPWEIESGIYFLAASAMQLLAGRTADGPVTLHLQHAEKRLAALITDPTPMITLVELRGSLAHDGDRLAALGGDLEVTEDADGAAIVSAWLPDQLAPAVDLSGSMAIRSAGT